MRTPILILAMATVGLVGCGQVSVPDAGPTTTTQPGPTTVPGSVVPATAPATTTTTARATTTTRALTRAEATSKLCTAVAEADERIQQGRLVSGGLRLGGGISSTEKTADPAVVAGARTMLRSGVNGSPDGYVTARQTTSAACVRAGYPIQLSGPIQCITDPCP